mmetsp:Transcript_1965/g.2380  ORF Transcript_1965/g.2380 Transcript_1965/m.2380 type:complete len:305 (-) Transcript_1965:233-1147(-)
MCRPTNLNPRSKTSLLLTSSSFHCSDEKGEKGPLSPSKISTVLTMAFMVGVYYLSEVVFRHFFAKYATDIHPLLEEERNRHVIARHLGVDGFACGIVSILGFLNRNALSEVMTPKRKDDESFHNRIHNYRPEGHRILLFFLAYQIKNTHDSYYWNDGAIFIAHHLFAGVTAWLGMYPGVASIYGIFFMGLSEVSTMILVLLSNFDPHFGIDGLEEAFPMTKVALGATFAILFIIIRVIVWPIVTYHFLLDALKVLKRDSVHETKPVKIALRMMVVSSVGLTALQLLWLGEIITVGQEEIAKLFS